MDSENSVVVVMVLLSLLSNPDQISSTLLEKYRGNYYVSSWAACQHVGVLTGLGGLRI